MIIRQRRIRNVPRHLGFVDDGAEIVIGVGDLPSQAQALGELGFSSSLPIGETLLPPRRGPISRFNADGGEIVHRDQPKETVYRQMEWRWTEWRGRDRVERTRIVDVPYQRYPRTPIPAPAIELTIAQTATGAKALVTPAITYEAANHDALRNRINLLLELFGECEVMTENLEPLFRAPLRRVNWELLPPGRLPWPQLRQRLAPLLDEMGPRTRPVAESRLQVLESLAPDFTAVGRGGFRGYVVFGFEDKGLFALESAHYGNATYVFAEDWQRLSQLTKAEIIQQDLAEERLIHGGDWEARLRAALS